ncbi:asparagine synthase (glutamine-hydrolyzing) [Candidatus Woesearchaeota archaeon]|nr:asparagine synthase (glutamine-hydrolyzing) [Nanoarchaeota archaeon]MCB9370110.1 asparagine synthase (glutamine-hydrolyzing) [Candidatus Woesearchaeota archaeon]USN44641.1 MAG: asparagine synthase (glutamine-hydrolyzing) [Candidatus Woesearchaeota archaeon]
MCGINGFSFPNETLVENMNKAISHRGPDGGATHCEENISLGHLRLAIIDLSEAAYQPMFYSKEEGASNSKIQKENNEKAKYCIVFNGEIYNYQELRKELGEEGYHFTTQGDTEVIMAAYDKWGEDCCKHFNGMWAFVIYDRKKQQLFCSRDRLGVKPFYYHYKNETFIFSSELKGILEHKHLRSNQKNNIVPEAVEFYFTLGYIPAPLTIFESIYKLEAGHNLIFDLKKKETPSKRKYFQIPKYEPEYNRKKLIEEGKELLKDATKIRLRSDVPVGAFLSGGLDSSSVVASMKNILKEENSKNKEKVHTYSVGFKEKEYDETPYISLVKKQYKTKHHHQYFIQNDLKKAYQHYVKIFDEPFADYSALPQDKISEEAKKEVTVLLTGDGGDEIFSGYNAHLAGKRLSLLRKLPVFVRKSLIKLPSKKNLASFTSFYLLTQAAKLSLCEPEQFHAKALESEKYLPKTFQKWSEQKLKECLKLSKQDLSDALRLYDLLYNTLADNFLCRADRVSMYHALELRSPFLDYRFIEYSQTIPHKYRLSLHKTKTLMREIIKDLVPQEIISRGKQGFEPPLDKWILEESDKFSKILKKYADVFPRELSEFYEGKVLKEENKLFNIYKIRLYIWDAWYKKWVAK